MASAKKADDVTAAAKRAAASATVKGTAKTPAAKGPAKDGAGRLAVKADETPWTDAELDEIRAGLLEEMDELKDEISAAERGIQGLIRDGSDGSGDDQADAGAKTLEREHEITLTNNARTMLYQIERALERIEGGSYGVCESCGSPIGKLRLQAQPRATLCLACKSKQERR